MQLSKADAGKALNAFVSSTSAGINIIDSRLNDSGLIGMSIVNGAPELRLAEDDDPYGDGTTVRYEFTVLPDRIELAETETGGGPAFSCTLDMEKFVRASIDPTDPDSSFILNFANRELSLRTEAGPGLISNRVEIADIDGDGTSAPSEKLHVIGNICATGTIGACSDERLKQDIDPLSGAIETINQLQGVSYSWKTDEFSAMNFSSDRQIGFIAQELKEILPSVVSQGADGYYTVDYVKLTPVLVEAMKEQQKQLDDKQSQIDDQQRQIDELEKIVQQLADQNGTGNASYGMK